MANWPNDKCGACGFQAQSTLKKKRCPRCGKYRCRACWGGNGTYIACKECVMKGEVKEILDRVR